MASPNFAFVSNNTILNTGVIPGYGFSGVNGAIGILFDAGTYSTISYNFVQYTGYIGIRFDGQYHLVDSNIVLDTMLTMADGGPIYCWVKYISNLKNKNM